MTIDVFGPIDLRQQLLVARAEVQRSIRYAVYVIVSILGVPYVGSVVPEVVSVISSMAAEMVVTPIGPLHNGVCRHSSQIAVGLSTSKSLLLGAWHCGRKRQRRFSWLSTRG